MKILGADRKKQAVAFVTASLMICACRSADYGDINIDETNPYAFHMFENVNLCLEIFNRERHFLQDLKATRARLQNQLAALKALQSKPRSAVGLSRASLSTLETLAMADRLNESTRNFPDTMDLDGAVNAMVLLYDTYSFDLSLSLQGAISLRYYDKIGGSFRMEVLLLLLLLLLLSLIHI